MTYTLCHTCNQTAYNNTVQQILNEDTNRNVQGSGGQGCSWGHGQGYEAIQDIQQLAKNTSQDTATRGCGWGRSHSTNRALAQGGQGRIGVVNVSLFLVYQFRIWFSLFIRSKLLKKMRMLFTKPVYSSMMPDLLKMKRILKNKQSTWQPSLASSLPLPHLQWQQPLLIIPLSYPLGKEPNQKKYLSTTVQSLERNATQSFNICLTCC